ncbi:MAG: GFA family protein [Moraxellaceae bacterium]|nr:GFA family protein [Moraxellaceae bacterium]MBH2029670.1 GFA family protein [Moraxellaceae bacterium]
MTVLEQEQRFNGTCLCGEIKFQFHRSKIKTIYRCYCSLCRKQSGTASNTATLISSEQFDWQQGEQFIQTYLKVTGFTSSFCRQCGSPVPNALGSNTKIMWIPLGLIQQDFRPDVELNFCMNSKTSWAGENKVHTSFDELPNGIQLQEYFELNE